MKSVFHLSVVSLLASFALFSAGASPITPQGEQLKRQLDGLGVESHWLPKQPVHWLTGDQDPKAEHISTHCSTFAAAACARLGVDLLRPPEHRQALLANAQTNWLQEKGPAEGWQAIDDPVKAQELANDGSIVLAAYRNPEPKKPGHIALVRPSAKPDDLIRKEGPDETQAGRENYTATSVAVGFKNHPGAWENHEILFFAHPWNGSTLTVAQIEASLATPATPAPKKVYPPVPALPLGQVPPPESKRIHVALYTDSGSNHGGDAVARCLAKQPGKYECFQVDAAAIRAGVLSHADVLVQGGGSGSACAKQLQPAGCEEIRAFVKKGGGYLGICAGAYLASSYYPWSLHIINTKVIDREHWARGKGTIALQFSEDGKSVLGPEKETVDCIYNQGPLMGRAEEAALPAYRELATFQSEVALNGAPTGVMKGTTAIAAAAFNDGKVICVSPHPEATKGLDPIIRHAVDFITPESARTREGSAAGSQLPAVSGSASATPGGV